MVYEALPDAPSNIDQLQWWRVNQKQLPNLAYLVRVIFALPVASSKSARVFGVASNTVKPNRSSLVPDTVEAT